MPSNTLAIQVERRIYQIRGQNVMVDYDLAALYRVRTKALNQAVCRNRDQFPSDFMFRLNAAEAKDLGFQTVAQMLGNWSQIVTGSQKHRDPRTPALCFYRRRSGHAF